MHKYEYRQHEARPISASPGHLPREFPNLWWGLGAAYAPGYPIHNFRNLRRLSGVVEYRHIRPNPKSPPHVPKASKPTVISSIPGIVCRLHLPKLSTRHVRFDLPSHGKDSKGEDEKRSGALKNAPPEIRTRDFHRSDTREMRRAKPDLKDGHILPKNISRGQSPSHNRRPIYREQRSLPRPPISPQIPTIHIITYAINHAPQKSDAKIILDKHLPPGTDHLYTIHAYKFNPPPEDICRLYSGVSPVVQDYVMRDPRARKAVREAIDDIIRYGRKKWERGAQRDGKKVADAKGDVSIGICCYFGTHRSVGIAELIARAVEEWVSKRAVGVRVRVVHVHRVRGERDPY